ACMEAIEEEGLMQIAIDREEYLRNRIEQELGNEIKEVRGVGLMLGIEFPFETKELAKDLLDEGIIANATAVNVLRLVPPLIITKEDIEALIGALKNVLTKNYAHA
ncbi:MAG TPA: aminotransferase class III-fold pyridoxal phosphate-dependent enzyme, partial [Saprospiraceae bacterium]|nr:aminotransferase class III-fold pyridoxal phosphate-dependent enzyme [Saprospiraceae bacterium]